jgi:hypothetical protein
MLEHCFMLKGMAHLREIPLMHIPTSTTSPKFPSRGYAYVCGGENTSVPATPIAAATGTKSLLLLLAPASLLDRLGSILRDLDLRSNRFVLLCDLSQRMFG